MKSTNDLTQLDKFIAMKNCYDLTIPKVSKSVHSVLYLGKEQHIGSYASCVKFKNQFKGQKDYKTYLIK